MARRHGLILSSIWEDTDFTDLLGEGEQRMYAFLLSQPNLNHAGLLPLTLRRWARKARGLTVEILQQRLDVLERMRFIVMDPDTEELLIRSFIRNDGVWRMPRVMGAAVAGAQEISSHKLRRALCAEMPRIPLDELSDVPGPKGPSIRAQVQEHITTLLHTIAVPEPTPPTPTREPVAEPLATVQESPSATPGEPLPQPLGNPSGTPSATPDEGDAQPSTHVRAEARATRSPSPAPSPAPAPNRESAGASASGPPQAQPDKRYPLPEDFALTDAMRRWAASTFPLLDPDFETQQFTSYYRADGGRRVSWPDQWQKWMRDSAKRASERAQQSPVQGAFLTALPGGRPLTGTDATVQGWLDLRESS